MVSGGRVRTPACGCHVLTFGEQYSQIQSSFEPAFIWDASSEVWTYRLRILLSRKEGAYLTAKQYQRKELQGLVRFFQVPTPSGTLIALHTRVHARTVNMRTYCVYNHTRECFLSLGVTPADTTYSRLKGLIGRLKLRIDEGLWVVPSCGIHTVGVLFPLDLIYLDEKHQVIHIIEHFPRFRIAPLRTQASSVLELPTHTIYSSQTQLGDQLLICAVEEIASRFNRSSVARLKSQPQGFEADVAYETVAKEPNLFEIKK